MTITDLENPATQDHPDPEKLAAIGIAEWLRHDQAASEEHDEAMRADRYAHEMGQRLEAADRTFADARARVSGLTDKLNLDGRRMLVFWLGGATVLALVTLDAIPLNWAAQAFGLNAASSWLVTMILLAASVGAMACLETTRHDPRRHAALVAITLTAYAGLAALRTSFLVTVAGETIGDALLQAVVLSAISAGLVFLGSAVMARTKPLRLSRALAAERRARHALEVSEVALRQAEEMAQRHLGVLRRQLIRQPLYGSVPSAVTHVEWVAALEHALHAQFAKR